jgi:hypothetical protein
VGGAVTLGVLLLLALLPSGAAAIVGGTPPNRAWPAQAYVTADLGTGTRSCGGTLVSGRWVLTAGHCVTDKATLGQPRLPATAFTVSLGSTDLTQFPQRFTVDEVLRDPRFAPRDGTAAFDAALLHLAAPTPAAPDFEPMRLITPAESGLWAAGTVATVLGWGSSVFRGPLSQQLQQAGVAINGDDGCAGAYPASALNFFAPLSMLCAGDGTTDTCTGDSGGPLLVPRVDTFALAAVTSYGFVCGDPAKPGVYARTGAPSIDAWVRDHVPTAAIAIGQPSPEPSTNVTLSASARRGDQLAAAQFRWDLDDDGQYDDDNRVTTTLRDIPAGSTVVRVQQTYPDGDRAVAREVITTAGSPLPRPPPPPPPPPRPLAPDPPRPGQPTVAQGSSIKPLPPLARLLTGPRRMAVKSLLDGRMSIRVACSVACALSGRLTLDGRTARRVGLTKFIGSTLIGTGTRRLARAGSVTLVIRLKPRAARALRRARDGAVRVRITAKSGKRTLRLERTITLYS